MRRLLCACRFPGGASPSAQAQPRRLLHATRGLYFAEGRKDPYSVLGVPKESGKEDVKKAYYKLVKK